MLLLASSVCGLFKWRQFEPEVILRGVGWVGGHARPTCAPSLTRSFTCCEPVASGACYPALFPRPGTVYHYFRAWKDAGVLAELQRALHEQARLRRGRLPCPSVVILDSQSVKTTERGGWSAAHLHTFFSAPPFPFLSCPLSRR